MNSLAPSTEQKFSGSPHDRTAGADAGQPEHVAVKWLARAYDRFIEKHGDDLEVIGIAGCAAVPVGLAFGAALVHGPFWAITITACSVGFYAAAMSSVVGLRDKLAEIKDSKLYELCEARSELCDTLMAENSQLEHDKAHLLCERGGLLRRLKAAETEAAAGELSRSENKEASAAVFEFPDPKGAA
jgi:hypothetical protein